VEEKNNGIFIRTVLPATAIVYWAVFCQ